MKKSVKIGIIVVILLISSISIYYYNNLPLEVEVELVEKTTLVSDFKETGKIVADEKYSIPAPYDGRVNMIIKLGEEVEKGDLIAVFDHSELTYGLRQINGQLSSLNGQRDMSSPQIYQAQVEALEIAIDMAKTGIERLEDDLETYRSLYEAGAVAKIEVDSMEKALEDGKKSLELREKELDLVYETNVERKGTEGFYQGQRSALIAQRDSLNSKISRSKVYAPGPGIVTGVYVTEGVFASSTMPILDISNNERLVARTNILVRDGASLKLGDKVKVVQKLRNEDIVHEGIISRISPLAKTTISPLGLSEQRVEVDIEFEGARDLFIGYDLDIIIETKRLEDVIVLSRLSIFRENGRYFLWKVEEDIIKKQEVKIGYESDFEVEILEGINEGDIIIMDPNNTALVEGGRVTY